MGRHHLLSFDQSALLQLELAEIMPNMPDTPGEAGGLMSWAASKAVVRLHNHQFQYGV